VAYAKLLHAYIYLSTVLLDTSNSISSLFKGVIDSDSSVALVNHFIVNIIEFSCYISILISILLDFISDINAKALSISPSSIVGFFTKSCILDFKFSQIYILL
jgi:hypothetical protein